MKIFIDSLNGHRAGELIATGLRLGIQANSQYTIVYNREEADACIMYATLANNERARLNIELMESIPSLLLHDDYNIPSNYCTKVVTAQELHFIKAVYYTSLYQNPIIKEKTFDFVYGGTYKKERERSYLASIPNAKSTLLIGDDDRWSINFPLATRMGTIRDLETLYNVMATAKRTFIADDANCEDMIPLRALEPHICNLKPLMSVITKDYADSVIADILDRLQAEVASGVVKKSKATIGVPVNTQDPHSSTDIDTILHQRGNIYGSYSSGVSCRAKILSALNEKHIETKGSPLSEELRIELSDIALKLLRIASDPSHTDSYIDLAGYAKIIKEAHVDGR